MDPCTSPLLLINNYTKHLQVVDSSIKTIIRSTSRNFDSNDFIGRSKGHSEMTLYGVLNKYIVQAMVYEQCYLNKINI